MAEGMGKLPANLLFALIAGWVSPDAAFVVGGLLSLTAALGLVTVRVRKSNPV